MKQLHWPLASNPYTVADRQKVADWLMSTDRYTMGEQVAAFEKAMSEFSGMHAVATSSGTTANQLLFDIWKVNHPGQTATVICPAVTWATSISPAILAGFDIEFCDINRHDFALNDIELEGILRRLQAEGKKAIVWPTALIGFVPNMAILRGLAEKYGAEIFMDCCENTLSRTEGKSILATVPMTTTSCFFSHQIIAVEFGFLFLRDAGDDDLARVIRNHGLSRTLPPDSICRIVMEQKNPGIDPAFLFSHLGLNIRPLEINAVFGLIDFAKREATLDHLKAMYGYYWDRLDRKKFFLPEWTNEHAPFCIPIFPRGYGETARLKQKLQAHGIETRPIVGGCLPLQPAFAKYATGEYPEAKWVHTTGFYVGIPRSLTVEDIGCLLELLHE